MAVIKRTENRVMVVLFMNLCKIKEVREEIAGSRQ